MRTRVAILLICLALVYAGCSKRTDEGQPTPQARLALPLKQRLDVPLNHTAANFRLTDFVSFIATSYKVPLLAEVVAPVPDVQIPAGSHTARKLLDYVVSRLPGYAWDDDQGIANIFEVDVRKAAGNILNLPVHYFMVPPNVWEFNAEFRLCLWNIAKQQGCSGGVIDEVGQPELRKEALGVGSFHDAPAGTILRTVLRENGRFHVLMAYSSRRPKLGDSFVFENWYTQSLVPDEPLPIWIQIPKESPN
jgi:hypothetical protein